MLVFLLTEIFQKSGRSSFWPIFIFTAINVTAFAGSSLDPCFESQDLLEAPHTIFCSNCKMLYKQLQDFAASNIPRNISGSSTVLTGAAISCGSFCALRDKR